MQVTETLSEGLKREFKVTVPADAMEGRLANRLTEIGQNLQMPGFRPGKAPMTLLRKTYGRSVLGEVLEQTVNETTTQALEQQELTPAMQPKIEITKFDEGSDLEFTLSVELMPEIEPIDFAGVKLDRLSVELDDDQVEERVKQLAEQYKAHEDAADGQAAQDGDTLVIDFVGRIDGEPFEGGSAEEFSLELGSGSFIPGFEDQLLGAKKDETRTVKVDFPEDYGVDELKGKAAEFEVTVKGVKIPLPTAIDDSLAEKLGLENLDALKQAVREQTEREFGEVTRARLKRGLLDVLADQHSFEVPPGMVDMEFEQIWEQVTRDLERQEKTVADLDKPEDEAKAEYRGIAERRVRLGLLLSEVGRRNNLEVSQDEVNRAIAEQASRFPGQERQVFEFYQNNPEMRAQLQAPLMEDKVVDFIVEMADVSDRKVSVDELMRDPDEEEEADQGGDDKS